MMSLIYSFIFNRTVLALLIAACFVVTGLDVYFDNSQAKVVDLAGMTIAKSSLDIIRQTGNATTPEGADALSEKLKEGGSSIRIRVFNAESAKDSFQKNAAESLDKDPKRFYQIDDTNEDQPILRYAVIASPEGSEKTYLEVAIHMGELENLESQQSVTTLWVLIIFAVVAALSMAFFVGFLRHSATVLVETQKKALEEQKQLTYAYGRFFPHQFLDLLNKKSILDIHLGDQTEKRMAVLFADIRNFTSLIEKKTPAESFKLINDYLRDVGPIIRKHNGFIDKYIGDAIMALFEKPDDAILATVEIIELLKKTAAADASEGSAISEIGSGIHFGDLMVGTVGELERMDGTVISDIVNTASRLENLNRSYGTHIIISEDLLNQLTIKDKLKIRFLDHIYAKGKSNGTKIYEVFNIDPPELIQKKEALRNEFEKAMGSYRKGEFKEALLSLSACQKILPGDPVLTIFIKRCEKYLSQGTPENWIPIAKLSAKDEVD